MLNNLENFIVKKIGELKNNVLLKREELKHLVDERTDEIVKELDVFERKCVNHLVNAELDNDKKNIQEVLDN